MLIVDFLSELELRTDLLMSLSDQGFAFLIEEYRACHARITRIENNRAKTQQFTIAALSGLYIWVFIRGSGDELTTTGLAVVPLIIVVIFYQQSRSMMWLHRNHGYIRVMENVIYSVEDGSGLNALGFERYGDAKRSEEGTKIKALRSVRSLLQNPKFPFYTTVGDIALWGLLLLISLFVAVLA